MTRDQRARRRRARQRDRSQEPARIARRTGYRTDPNRNRKAAAKIPRHVRIARAQAGADARDLSTPELRPRQKNRPCGRPGWSFAAPPQLRGTARDPAPGPDSSPRSQ